jgi:phospholipase C
MGHRDHPKLFPGLVWRATTTEMALLLPNGHRTHRLVARAERVGATTLVTPLTVAQCSWPLSNSYGWYDITVVAATVPNYLRRVSGRIDAPGRITCSDPFATSGQPV